MKHRVPGRRVTRLSIGLLATAALTVGGSAALAGADTTPRSSAAAASHGTPAKEEARNKQEARNKRIAVAFMDLAINQKQPQKAADLYMGDPFIQHNPQNADGKEAFVTWANGLIAAAPGVNVDVKRVLADGDLVMVHSHFTVSATDRGLAVADMFRIKNGKIVEHWDVIQAVPETSANDNTMF
jgi:predicted SnoaL-like aldol condensation-catalyzing enzyme